MTIFNIVLRFFLRLDTLICCSSPGVGLALPWFGSALCWGYPTIVLAWSDPKFLGGSDSDLDFGHLA